MQIYIDTADRDEIKEAISWGIVDGVTTNPSLIKKAMGKFGKKDMVQYILSILRLAGTERPVSLEVIGHTYKDIIREARQLYMLFSEGEIRPVIKIPVNPTRSSDEKGQYDGLKAIYKLAKGGILINATLVMTPEQALLAANAGAAYVSPFAGRIDDLLREQKGKKFDKSDYYPAEGNRDFGEDNGIVSGVDLVEKTVRIFRAYNLETKIIGASARNARHVRDLALTNVDIITIPFNVLKEMISHKKTYEGVAKFEKDVVPEYRKLFVDKRLFKK